MFRPRWRKVISDLLDSKLRTALVVFSIAVGVFSIGVISGAYVIISNDMSASYAANQPANVELRMSDFEGEFLDTMRNYKGIASAEGRRVFNLRVRVAGGQWTTIDIVAVEDFEANQVNLLTVLAGDGAPGRREIALSQEASEEIGVVLGGELELQLPDGTVRTLPVVGLVQDASTGADDFLAPPFGYISVDTLQYLRQPERYNRIYAIVSENNNDLTYIRTLGTQIKEKIEKAGYSVSRTRFAKTNEHPLAATVNAVLGILMALGILIVLLSSSLIANTLSALLNQHLRHIGVMKLVGARDRQIFVMYLALILSFGVLALLIAVPLGGQGAYALSSFIADQLSFSLFGYRIVPMAFLIQVLVGILVPLGAGFIPVISGSRVTILKAISGELARETGEKAGGSQPKESRWERFQLRATAWLNRRGIHIPRPLLISLRNTFRRRGRLLLTLFTLTMGGAIFIAVFNVQVTLRNYTSDIGQYFLADVTLDFDQPYRLREVEQQALSVPGVESVEGWMFIGTELLYPDGTTAQNLNILAPPANSRLVDPILVSGRWIRADDVRKMAVSEAILGVLPGLEVGDYVMLKIDGRDQQWEVVGIFKFVGREGILGYTPYEYAAQDRNLVNRSFSYRVVGEQHDRAFQETLAERLDTSFRVAGFKLRDSRPGLATLDTVAESLDILVTFLLIMALLTATVGAMGLTGTMGMNVLERTREIGIMRAIGAVDMEIMRMVIVEGMVIGGISWALGALLSVPFTYLLSTIVSLAIFETPIDVLFTPAGYGIWLGLVIVLSVLASVLPARNAARLTIREVLAYE